ncbi:glycosyl transferase [Aureococcus anophagefferens]|nr:glycosyl transferase [Aureococcus anophagefferens]
MVEPLDVVIPTVTKDYPTLGECVTSIFRYVADVRFVWLVSKERPPWPTSPPPTPRASVHQARGVGRCGEALSRRHLIVDSDIVFFRRVTMVEDGVALLSWQPEYKHGPYFEHLDKITGGRRRRADERMSGVAHHMVFDEACLDGLRAVVRTATGSPLWRAFLEYAVVPEGGDIAAGPRTIIIGWSERRAARRQGRPRLDLAVATPRSPLAHFALNATKDDALRRRIAADPRAASTSRGPRDAPSLARRPR